MNISLRIVLSRTEYASNIGASARAMANMGGDQLILIDPRTTINSKAKQGAAGAQEALASAIIYPTWEEFLVKEPGGVRVGLTRRAGKGRKVIPLEEFLSTELEKHTTLNPSNEKKEDILYLCFGTEADGLSFEELSHMHMACHLPVFGNFGSFNLAQAVLLASFIVRQKIPMSEPPQQTLSESPELVAPHYCPDDLIRDWIESIGFDINARSSSAYLTLKKLFTVHRPSRHEIIVVDEVLKQTLRKLKK
ncbi:RNA methyltransferase [bacterium]|nr:RNA methyltransferase [bacterium]